MINATLCSTNAEEPWAANVDFTIEGIKWTVELNSNYTHYKNIAGNNNVIVLYKTDDFEIIAKGTGHLAEPTEDGTAPCTIFLYWLRLVENETMEDFVDDDEIERVISTHL